MRGNCVPPFTQDLAARLLALNNAHAQELSHKTAETFRALIDCASHVRAEPEGLALLVGFDETCVYDNPNFHWLKRRFARFLYIDRVVVDNRARGRGLARALYDEVAHAAREHKRERLVCEINLDPPNPGSDAFHQKLGFRPIGQRRLASGKVVRYWEKPLDNDNVRPIELSAKIPSFPPARG